jgi:alpha-1,3-rhamnosyltransferase
MELVSVIVQAYNSAQTIERTLDSIKHQTYPNIELIISDDKSKDNTVEIAKNWLDDNNAAFNSVKLVTTDTNTGIPGSNNRALKVALGEYVEFIAADDYLSLDAVAKYVEYCRKNKDTIPISKVYLFSDDKDCDYTSVEEYCENCYRFANLDVGKQYKSILVKNVIVAPAAAFYPREILTKLNGFDEEYWIEDYPINIKILRNGYRFGLLDEPLVYYRISSTSMTGSGNARIKRTEAKLFFRKRFWYMLRAGMVREALGQSRYWIKYLWQRKY